MTDARTLQVVFQGDTRDLDQGVGRLHKALGGLPTAIGLGALGAGAALTGIAVAAVKTAADFESVMSGVKAVSGATAEEMKGLQALALQLGKDTVFSAKEAAQGIEELVKGGLSVPDIMNGAAKATLDLASAGGVSLVDAATIAANALAQFNLKGQDMAHVADLIAGAANASALDVGQFKFSLQAAGAVAATVGFSFDDLAEAIAVMGKAGIVGQDAGTSLKTMFLNLQPSTKTATAAMKELGLITADGANQFFTAQGTVKSMAEVAGLLQHATENLTSAQRLQKLETIFGTDAIRAAAIFAKEGATGFGTMAEAMGKVTAASVGAERLNNVKGSLEQLKGSLETAAITLGMTFLPVLKRLIDGATDMVNAVIPWIERHGPALVASFESATAAAGRVVTAIGQEGLKGAIDALAGSQGVFRPLWDEMARQMSDFAPTGERLERLFRFVGAAVAFARDAVVKLWPSGTGQGPSFFKALATEVNALSAEWERLIDDFVRSATQISDFYAKTKPFWDLLERLMPGSNGQPLIGPITGALGGIVPGLAGPTTGPGGGTTNVQSAERAPVEVNVNLSGMVGTAPEVARILQPELERILAVRR